MSGGSSRGSREGAGASAAPSRAFGAPAERGWGGRGAAGSYREALDYLFARTGGAFKLGLERTDALLAALGDPHRAVPVLHVAGTNGKGSSVATAEALLGAAGLRVARYTSPHLVDFRERIVAGGAPIPAGEVVEFVERWTPLIEELGATFFEATTAMAFAHFARSGADVALIETGLGGRLDATNVVHPLAAGVSSIALDHTEYLGDSLDAIAAEKAGIFKAGVPAVIGEADPTVRAVLRRHADARGASTVLTVDDDAPVSDVVVSARGTSFTVQLDGAPRRLTTGLVGEHQARNAAFALLWLRAAGAPHAAAVAQAEAVLPAVRLPGRFQRAGRFVFDVAHNPDGMQALRQSLLDTRPRRPVAALVCVLGDKDWRTMLAALVGEVDHLVLTDAPTAPASRRWPLDEALRAARGLGLRAEAIADFDAALARVQAAGETVLVTGSFHTVGDAMARLPVSPGLG